MVSSKKTKPRSTNPATKTQENEKAKNGKRGTNHELGTVAALQGKTYYIDSEGQLQKVEKQHITCSDVITKEAEKCGKAFSPDDVRHVGKSVNSELGDININGWAIEMKYITKSTNGFGTWHNTSCDWPELFGLKGYSRFLKENGFYELYDELFGEKYGAHTPGNVSPANQEISEAIRHDPEYVEQCKMFQNEEKKLRKRYLEYILDELQSAPELAKLIVEHLIKKMKAGNGKEKGIPDLTIAYYEPSNSISTLTKAELETKLDEYVEKGCPMHLAGKGELHFTGLVKIAIAWQNGTPFNNPTLRAFLL